MSRSVCSILVCLSLLFLLACQSGPKTLDLGDYERLQDVWYLGKAHVCSYELEQNRYNDVHPGHAILIQVTEDFDKIRHVKSDQKLNPNAIGALKSNLIKRFSTGLYDYSIMTSAFNPTYSNADALKVNMTSQDWCGQSFVQLNKNQAGYNYQSFSYFEMEGDETGHFPNVLLEDEVFNLIRMGKTEELMAYDSILPSLSHLRLLHLPMKAVPCTIEEENDDLTEVLHISFPTINRKLSITYDRQPPYLIRGWTDTYPSAFDEAQRTTKARLIFDEWTDYWKKNMAHDRALRNQWAIPDPKPHEVIQSTRNERLVE